MFKKIMHPGVLILAGFVAMLVFFVVIFIKARQNENEMVTDNYFEKELVFQKELDAVTRFKNLGDSASVNYLNGILNIKVPTDVNAKSSDLTVTVYHAAKAADDQTITVPQNESGQYKVPLVLENGMNSISVDFVSSGEKFMSILQL